MSRFTKSIYFILLPIQREPTIFQYVPLSRFVFNDAREQMLVFRKIGVALFFVVNEREVQPVCNRQHLLVHLRPAADKHLISIQFSRFLNRLFWRWHTHCIFPCSTYKVEHGERT